MGRGPRARRVLSACIPSVCIVCPGRQVHGVCRLCLAPVPLLLLVSHSIVFACVRPVFTRFTAFPTQVALCVFTALRPQVWAAGRRVSMSSEQSEDICCLVHAPALRVHWAVHGDSIFALMARGMCHILCFQGVLVSVSLAVVRQCKPHNPEPLGRVCRAVRTPVKHPS